MSKNLKIFYIIDLLIMIVSIIGMLIENNKSCYGLEALSSAGYFTAFLLVFIFSFLLLIIVSILYFIIKLKRKYMRNIIKMQKNEKILEKCLPSYLEKDLQNLKEGIKNNVSYIDCLIDELQGSVNSAFVDGDISEEQCDYLYKKYIRMEKEND